MAETSTLHARSESLLSTELGRLGHATVGEVRLRLGLGHGAVSKLRLLLLLVSLSVNSLGSKLSGLRIGVIKGGLLRLLSANVTGEIVLNLLLVQVSGLASDGSDIEFRCVEVDGGGVAGEGSQNKCLSDGLFHGIEKEIISFLK